MAVFKRDNQQFQIFIDEVEHITDCLSPHAKDKKDIVELQNLKENFKNKIADFYRQDRKLNIGIIGQVKAGKSSFLNTLLFEGKDILPKASTPKTATLTKMEYSENNIIHIEYYSMDEWEVLEENSDVDSEQEIYRSAREIINMVRQNEFDPLPYLQKGYKEIPFNSYNDLLAHLNDYVGEDGKYTPIVRSVTLYLNNPDFEGLSIVDTPGLNDPIASRTMRTKEFMEVCDVVFFLSQSSSFLDKSDWNLLSSQLPQKGVKKLVLIASKYDSGIRDILRKKDGDDKTFGSNKGETDKIPEACNILEKKLKNSAKKQVEEFISDLKMRGGSNELVGVIEQCIEPIFTSSLSYNMTQKTQTEYNPEEKNLSNALAPFSDNLNQDLRLLGNFDVVKEIFDAVVSEKEAILKQKEKSFVPTAQAELRGLLESFKERAGKRLAVLQGNDREDLLKQKKDMEDQINSIRANIMEVFGELNAKLESEKAKRLQQLREDGKDYLEIKERTGSRTRTHSYTTGFWFWKKTHYSTYEEPYSYCIAADAVENLRKYQIDAENQAEKVFTETLELKAVKRKLLDMIVNNFDMGSEKYDSSLFRIIVEDTVSQIEFPTFSLDISDEMNGITAKFTGELTSGSQKTELTVALTNAISNISQELSNKLVSTVKSSRDFLNELSKKIENDLLNNINQEFESLLSQYENKEAEICGYEDYISLLDVQITALS